MTRLPMLMIAITSTFAGAALAEPVPATATLAAAAVQPRITGETGVWRCDGSSCTGLSDTHISLAVAVCSTVAAANGRVASFTSGTTSFGDAELKRCNRHVR